jgi:hypothetical protein
VNHQYQSFLGSSQAPVPGVAAIISILVVLAIDVRMIFYCLDDLNRRQIVTVFDRQIWTAVIILGGPIGQIAYWLYGRGPY